MNNQIVQELVKCCNDIDNNVKYSKEIKNISHHLEDLCGYNKILNGVINKEFIDSCLTMFKCYNYKNINVNIECDIEYITKYDYLTLKCIVLNLLSNAYKYNKYNGNIDIFVDENSLQVYNTVCEDFSNIESNKIGLLYCEKIMKEKPKIDFEYNKSNYFVIKIELV